MRKMARGGERFLREPRGWAESMAPCERVSIEDRTGNSERDEKRHPLCSSFQEGRHYNMPRRASPPPLPPLVRSACWNSRSTTFLARFAMNFGLPPSTAHRSICRLPFRGTINYDYRIRKLSSVLPYKYVVMARATFFF